MPGGPPLRRVRKGTKSCVECRRRKVRCIWTSEEAQTCRNCQQHDRRCVSQNEVEEDPDEFRLTSRERIRQLEGEVTNIWAYVRRLEHRLDDVPPSASAAATTSTPNESLDQREDREMPDSMIGDFSPNAPTYLKELFGGASLDSRPPKERKQSTAAKHEALFAEKRQRLQRLLPSKQDVVTIARHFPPWLSLYHGLFPTLYSVKDVAELLYLYDRASNPQAHPATVAALLLALAITMRQTTQYQIAPKLETIGDVNQFVDKVEETVEETIVLDEALAATTDGIEISISFVRLQLVHINVKKAWLMLRRVISLAEMIGLPRLAARFTSSFPDRLSAPVERDSNDNAHAATVLWTTICAVDRIISMLFNLPIGTSNYPFYTTHPVDPEGKVVPFMYLCRLADIATHVQAIDDIIGSGQPVSMVGERILKADQELQTLAGLTPSGWWRSPPDQLSPDHFVQCWHQYITLRLHLHVALHSGKTAEYAYSYMACTAASKDLVQRYVTLRLSVSSGFFAWRIFDLQVLAAAVFLIHSRDRVAFVEYQQTGQLVQSLLNVMTAVAELPYGEFAKEAALAIRSLMALLDGDSSSTGDGLTLSIPLVGKLHIRRRTSEEQRTQQQDFRTSNGQPPAFSQRELEPLAATSGPNACSFPTDPSSWWVEVPTEFPFLSDELSGIDQWSSFSVLDGM